ncbi:Cysteine protease [Actinidia chinensis var. chinensis]|uniref:Cysteine protease n=1 Tax=Actinidia chinensis var. chinensis TaxID=1590841 RepID=A0A2R6PAU3_ACTCC|nr:Cysteine protease [Actinidia chinensis var. chinensis]
MIWRLILYHTTLILRHVPLDSINPSFAIGQFYCRDKDDFDDFCDLASKLADQSKGAPLFIVTQTGNKPKTRSHYDIESDSAHIQRDGSFDVENNAEGCTQEDDWQLL